MAACVVGMATGAAAIGGSAWSGQTNRGETADERLQVPRSSWRAAHLPGSSRASIAVRVFPTADGGMCDLEDVPQEGRARTCWPPDRFEGQLLVASWGGRQTPGARSGEFSYAWVWGLTSTDVDRVELVFADCKAVPLPRDRHRFFLHVLAPVTTRPATWPHALVARDRSGRALEVDELNVVGPPSRAQPNRLRPGPTPASDCDW